MILIKNFSIELIDLRVINPINYDLILKSICKTKRFIVVDGGWKTCGLASEIISSVVEKLDPNILLSKPINLSFKNCPAPSSNVLERGVLFIRTRYCKFTGKRTIQ